MAVAEPIVFNPLDPAFRSDPYPIYRRLLEEAPVFQTVFGVPAFSRYADVVAMLKDHRHFSSDDRKSSLYGCSRRRSRRRSVSTRTGSRRPTGLSSSWTRRTTRGCGDW